MADAPPKFLKGPTVAALLLLAIALTVVVVVKWTRPTETDVVDKVDAPAPDPQPLSYYLARADVARGEAYFSRCSACHTIAQGGPPSIGPNLYGVMGGPIAARPGYNYSRALRDKGGSWDWEAANRFLRLPRSFAPGTKMTFAGVLDPQDRADVMLYLDAQGGSLPPPGATAGGAPAASAPAQDPALTRAFLIGRWQTDSCSPPAIRFEADGTTGDGRRWTLFGDRLIVSRGTTQEQSVVERLGRDRIRLNTRDGPFELTRCPLIPAIG